MLGELLDGIAAISKDPCLAVEVGDGALAGGGLHERRVVDEERRIELAYRVAGKMLSVIGTVTCLPVRSSMMVMVSGMLFPYVTRMIIRGLLPGSRD